MKHEKQSVSFKFIKNLGLYNTVKPYAFNVDTSDFVPPGKETNIEYETRQVEVTDVRDGATTLSLDVHSFIFLRHPESLIRGVDIVHFPTRQYCETMTALVQEKLGADAAFCYDIRVNSYHHSMNNGDIV